MSNKIIRIAVPKGRILKELKNLFTDANIVPDEDIFNEETRSLTFKSNHENIEFIRVRSFDISTFVASGGSDIGIAGLDVITEFNYTSIYKPLDLKIGKCRLSLATTFGLAEKILNTNMVDKYKQNRHCNLQDVHNLSNNMLANLASSSNINNIRIATKYPNISKSFFLKQALQVDYIKLNGALELAPILGMSDYIVDLVSTGKTLKENTLKELYKILDISSHLIVSKTAFHRNTDKISDIIKKFSEVVNQL